MGDAWYVTHSEIYFNADQVPDSYLFFKQIGASIAPFRKMETALHLKTGLCLSLATLSGVKHVEVEDTLEEMNQDSDGFLYFRSFEINQVKIIKAKMEMNLNYRIFFLSHTLLDIRHEFEKLKSLDIDLARISFLVSNPFQLSNIHTKKVIHAILPETAYCELIIVRPHIQPKQIRNSKENKAFGINLFFIISLLKVFLAPGYFLKRQLERMRVNNFIWFIRFEEFILFIYFVASFVIFKLFGFVVDTYYLFRLGVIKSLYIIRHLILMTGFKSVGVFVDAYQVCRTWFIRLGFVLRHLILMTGFKSFGVVVDTYQLLRTGIIRMGFYIRHFTLMTIFKTFGLFVDTYYILKAALVHTQQFSKLFTIRSFFIIRHVVIMAGVKTYYFVKDVIIMTLFHRFLLYPFYKIYWFTSFQYRKRIKKEIL